MRICFVYLEACLYTHNNFTTARTKIIIKAKNSAPLRFLKFYFWNYYYCLFVVFQFLIFTTYFTFIKKKKNNKKTCLIFAVSKS